MFLTRNIHVEQGASLIPGFISIAPGTYEFGEDADAFSNRGDVWFRKTSGYGAGQSIDFSVDPEISLGELKLYFNSLNVSTEPAYTHFIGAESSSYHVCLYKDANNYAVLDITSMLNAGSPGTSYAIYNWSYVRGVGTVSGALEAVGFVETDFGT